TALTGLLIGLHQAGIIGTTAPQSASTPAVSATKAAATHVDAQPSVSKEQISPEPMAEIRPLGGSLTVVAERYLKLDVQPYIKLESGQKIPFEKLKSIELLDVSESRAQVRLTLQDGSRFSGFSEACSYCDLEGVNQLGKYVIAFRKVKTV